METKIEWVLQEKFAPQYPRSEEGWVIFPDDSEWRRAVFPPEVMAHSAKAPPGLIVSIVEYVSKPGETILDPMTGSGTIMLAALAGRNVICIEIEDIYQASLLMARQNIELDTKSTITILQGDCRDFLPIMVNHIIFSPPYAQILTTRKGPERESTKYLAGSRKGVEDGAWSPDYTKNTRNIGRLNKFLYNQAMEKVYKLCYDSILPGGTMTVILKDYIKQGKRVYLSDWLIRTCVKMGFENIDWFKRDAPGTGFLKLWRSRGYATVQDEDVVIFRRNK